jgi:hypothetical protein
VSKPTRLDAGPNAAEGVVTYSSLLRPGEERVLDFKMPVVPTADPAAMTAIDEAAFDTAKRR